MIPEISVVVHGTSGAPVTPWCGLETGREVLAVGCYWFAPGGRCDTTERGWLEKPQGSHLVLVGLALLLLLQTQGVMGFGKHGSRRSLSVWISVILVIYWSDLVGGRCIDDIAIALQLPLFHIQGNERSKNERHYNIPQQWRQSSMSIPYLDMFASNLDQSPQGSVMWMLAIGYLYRRPLSSTKASITLVAFTEHIIIKSTSQSRRS